VSAGGGNIGSRSTVEPERWLPIGLTLWRRDALEGAFIAARAAASQAVSLAQFRKISI
jgi:hypothetical protein